MKDKIAFVCQRYGLEVNGGAELLCRQLAEKLKAIYEVEVYTTCAVDYVTWENSYRPGTEVIHGVTVHRFASEKPRNQKSFDKISERVFSNPNHSDTEEEEWIDQQGPVCPKLLEALAKNHKEYKAVLFMTYLYYLTAKGLPMGFENAVLIPTVHDEPPVYLRYYDKVFESARGFLWNTEEEKNFAEHRFPQVIGKPDAMGGAGVDVPPGELPQLPEQLRGKQYLVYAGRIDESKGCGEMFAYFFRYKKEHRGDLKLALMGRPVMPVPRHPDIISLGFVPDEMKFAVMRDAEALVLFSHFESLSMVVLESMAMGRPVLVNGKCEVLKGHCLRSNAGLYFENYPEFVATLDYLLTHREEYEIMRENGKRYVEEHYQWDVITESICRLICQISGSVTGYEW